MRVLLLSLTLLAEVEVRADTALVPDALDGSGVAAIADNIVVDLISLIGSLLAQVVNHHSLEGLSGVGLDFLLEHLDQAVDVLAIDLASTVALSAGKSFSVYLCTSTSEAFNLLLVDLFFIIFWSDDLAVDFLLLTLNLHLVASALSEDNSTA